MNDTLLIQIAEGSLADATRRAGHWLACRPGCCQCCTAPFPISQLDGHRLQQGLIALHATYPTRAGALRQRVADSIETLTPEFPGDPVSGILDEEDERFEDWANDAVCPVLDPATGTCDLYNHRPIPCRTFGPPVANEDGGLGTCELCFIGAPPETVKAAEMDINFLELETRLNETLEHQTGLTGNTIVAFALRNR